MKLLVVYGTTEGQTAKIATQIARTIREHGIDADVMDGRSVPADLTLTQYDGVIVGASLHYHKFQRYIQNFVKAHRDQLRRMPSAFFSVSITEAYKDPKGREELATLTNRWLTDVDWQPDKIASFAGALAYTQYGWLKRNLQRWFAGRAGGSTDTSRDHEYTDWDAVARFADEFATMVHSGQHAVSPGV